MRIKYGIFLLFMRAIMKVLLCVVFEPQLSPSFHHYFLEVWESPGVFQCSRQIQQLAFDQPSLLIGHHCLVTASHQNEQLVMCLVEKAPFASQPGIHSSSGSVYGTG